MKNKKIRAVSISLLLASMLLFASASIYTYYQIQMLGNIKAGLEDPLEAWSESSYIVWQYNSTFYATRNMSTLIAEYLGSSDDEAIQYAVNESSTYGGTVYVKAPTYTGTYNAAVTLKDNVTLIVEQGSAGITITIDSGATATLMDYQNSLFQHWKNGNPVGLDTGSYSYAVFKSGSYYYARNGSTGAIDYSGTNRTIVINNAINGLPHVNVQLPNAAASVVSAPHGKIIIKGAAYPDSGTIQVPLGSRIIIEGEGTTHQMIGNGINGGTQIINTGTSPTFECLATSGAVTSTGTMLVLKNIEFVQQVNLASAQIACVNLDGMAQGILENVQVVRNYTENTPLTGVGIKCINNIGGDHAGGDTLWLQVQVCGFTYGLNCSIDHWKAIQLDIANCTTAINWYNNLATRLEDVHVFQCDRIFALYGGFTEYGHISINGLYLEECGGGVDNYEWFVNSTFHGYVRIYNTNVNTVASAGTLWRCNDNATLWFEDVMVTGGAPAFPSVVAPSTNDDERYMNDKLQAVEVFVFWSNIVDIEINGAQVTTTDDKSACFFLRPGDTIQVDLDGGSYSWYWRAVSAERGHQDD